MALPWLVLVAALAAWSLGLRRGGLAPPTDALPGPAELALVALVALTLAAWWALWLGPWSLFPWPVLARDFAQVCEAVVAAAAGHPGAAPQRSPVAALLPAALSHPLGLVDGLLAASALSTAALLAALYLWARATHDRLAGLAAALLAGAAAPLATLPRQLTLYPELLAAFALSAAAAAAALRWRRPAALLLCGLGAGLALLVDPRGLLHALAALLCGLLALRRPRDLAPLLAPLPLSWLLARALWPADAPGLELQLSWYRADPAPLDHPAFLWGHSPLAALPATLAWLAAAGGPAALPPWAPLAALALPAALWPLRRDPRRLLGLLTLLAPFAAVAPAAAAPRHQAWALLPLPLLAGLALGALAAGPGRRPLGLPLTAALLLALVAGLLPGPLSPSGRPPLPETPDIDALLQAHPAATADLGLPYADPACVAAIRRDLAAGHPWGGRWAGPWPTWELPR